MRYVAFGHDGLGYVFLDTERFPEAWAHLTEEYKIGKATNAKPTIAYSADLRALASWKLGRYEEAQADLAETLASQPRTGYKTLATATWSAAALASTQRKFPEASTKAQRAMDLASSEFKVSGIRARWTLGQALAFSGQAAAGRKRCEEAVQLARNMRNPRWLSEALLALAEVLLAPGRTVTMASAVEAESYVCPANSASPAGAHMRSKRAQVRTGRKGRARELATKADSVLSFLTVGAATT